MQQAGGAATAAVGGPCARSTGQHFARLWIETSLTRPLRPRPFALSATTTGCATAPTTARRPSSDAAARASTSPTLSICRRARAGRRSLQPPRRCRRTHPRLLRHRARPPRLRAPLHCPTHLMVRRCRPHRPHCLGMATRARNARTATRHGATRGHSTTRTTSSCALTAHSATSPAAALATAASHDALKTCPSCVPTRAAETPGRTSIAARSLPGCVAVGASASATRRRRRSHSTSARRRPPHRRSRLRRRRRRRPRRRRFPRGPLRVSASKPGGLASMWACRAPRSPFCSRSSVGSIEGDAAKTRCSW